MNRTITWVAAAALLALGACNKKSENPPAGNPSGSAMMAGSGSAMAGSGSAMATGSGSAVAAGTGAGSAAPPANVDVPTEMDFEDTATAKITDKNVEAEVKAIEKELEDK